MNIRVSKNYGQLSRKNVASMMLKSKDSTLFNKFMMTDSELINDQLHEFQNYIRYFQLKRNKFSDDYQVSCLINKLSPFCSTFAGDLCHEQNNLTLIQALKAVHIKDQHR